ncbi:NAD(P)/FAD-dependent oxidoreductase [Solirubrobacter ginsenosidimutans]|uniref:NADH:ubiquinone reductase (non-electrogenic) n=1 Tax=Solirubrobacter ginsenosidimutans TaxID=490573 RepID=A0A9X3MPY0_9ACTN|nr:NAD(P)/FAD-dependent oxidoreductase [Solirubrobacter ginsenosidimutans]MDA0160242.1 NAD(P)/FAD-dependent oxidoreductase [Solirubrobacter ginsenosidimutans]
MHRVVIVGGGFGGLQAALHLKDAKDVEITLVDRRNFHLFQPLAYQVATGALAAGEVCYPLRAIFRGEERVKVMLAEATGFDLGARTVALRTAAGEEALEYDTLLVGGGSKYNYFGHPEWQEHAAELKSLEGALHIRAQILRAFETAELAETEAERDRQLTFVIVGAGPTGVEMAGQIAEIARNTRRDFRNIDTRNTKVLLVEAGDRVLASFPPKLSGRAMHSLVNLGVTPMLNAAVTGIDPDGVTVGDDHIRSATVIWAAGVLAAGVSSMLAEAAGAETDKVGRLIVEPDLSLPGHPEVLAIGDMVQVRGAHALPGVAPVAMQMGRYAAKLVKGRLRAKDVGPFKYKDKGNLATIGRGRAVAELPPGIRAWGFPAWALWLGIHLFYLVGFQNRLLVFIRWGFSFVTHGRGTRLITGEQNMP